MQRSALCRSRRELSNEYLLFTCKIWLRYSRERAYLILINFSSLQLFNFDRALASETAKGASGVRSRAEVRSGGAGYLAVYLGHLRLERGGGGVRFRQPTDPFIYFFVRASMLYLMDSLLLFRPLLAVLLQLVQAPLALAYKQP